MKFCSTCSVTPTPFQIVETAYFQEFYPPHPRVPVHAPKGKIAFTITGLKPLQTIFYFAAQKASPGDAVPKSREDAYGKLQNSGVGKSDNRGNAVFYLDCPGVYRDEKGRIYPRHLHFVYFDGRYQKKINTHKVFCNVPFSVAVSKVLLIDALPTQFYQKEHIPGALSLPHDKTHSRQEVFNLLKLDGKKIKPGEIPLVLYCYSKDCGAAEHLKEQLDRLGFVNTFHYLKGLVDWKDKQKRRTKKK